MDERLRFVARLLQGEAMSVEGSGNRVATADSPKDSRYPAAAAGARPLHHRLYARRSPGSADPRFAGEVVESFAHDAPFLPTARLFGRTRDDYRALGYKFPVKFINVVGCEEAKVAVLAKSTGMQAIGAPT